MLGVLNGVYVVVELVGHGVLLLVSGKFALDICPGSGTVLGFSVF